MKQINIGITDCSKWDNYDRWLASENVKTVRLSEKENNIQDLDHCDGVILSGGDDVHPRFYGQPELFEKRDKLNMLINEERDRFEFEVLKKSIDAKKPVLGICRGLQLANVYFEGNLIPDLDGEAKEIHSKSLGNDRLHDIMLEQNSLIHQIINSDHCAVNSAHHQAADKVNDSLRVTARSKDGVVEAIEYSDPMNMPFFLLIQWHPERMPDDAGSEKIKLAFLEAASKR